MKIALAHDSFTQLGGAERVVDMLHELYPDAPVFTLVFDPVYKEKYKGWIIKTSGLQTLYLALGKLQYLLPFIPWGVHSLDFNGFDVVLSSSSGFIKNILVPKSCVHINYCHTPARFLWSEPEYVKQEVNWYLRPFINIILKKLKEWDFTRAQKVNFFIANSAEVQKRIKEYYNRDSVIIPAGVDTNFWKPTIEKSNYFLLAGRLQAHKNNEIFIEIFNELGLSLHVVGSGRQEAYLKSVAGPNITFYGRLSDEELRDQYSGALAFLYPQVEDFGLMPLEAAACGTATLAYGKGGALETVVPGVTGELFENYDKEKIKDTLKNWHVSKYNAQALTAHAKKFDKEVFKNSIKELVKKYYENRG